MRKIGGLIVLGIMLLLLAYEGCRLYDLNRFCRKYGLDDFTPWNEEYYQMRVKEFEQEKREHLEREQLEKKSLESDGEQS